MFLMAAVYAVRFQEAFFCFVIEEAIEVFMCKKLLQLKWSVNITIILYQQGVRSILNQGRAPLKKKTNTKIQLDIR